MKHHFSVCMIAATGSLLQALAEELPKCVSEAKILAMCEGGGLSFDKLQEPHASIAERLSKTKLIAALSAGSGSAVAFVSSWPEYTCIDKCVVNPGYLALGQDAEAHLIEQIVQQALDSGTTDVRLTPTYQVDDEFYSSRGFFPPEGSDDDGTLRYRGEGAEAEAEKMQATPGLKVEAPEPVKAAAPETKADAREKATDAEVAKYLAEAKAQAAKAAAKINAKANAEPEPEQEPEAEVDEPAADEIVSPAPAGFEWGGSY